MAETTSTAATLPAPAGPTLHPAGLGVSLAEAPAKPDIQQLLRLPTESDPPPHHGRLLLVSAWSAVLVMVGLVVAVQGLAAALLNSGPGWLLPVATVIGAIGIVAAGLAFASIHRAGWAFRALGTATVALVTNLTLMLVFL
jgi:hypothetical protein